MLYHLLELFNPDHQPYAYTSVLFRATCAILLAFVLVVLLGPRTIRYLLRLNLGDKPEFDHAPLNELMREKSEVPTMGGVLIVAVVLFCSLLFAQLTNYYVRMACVCMIWLGILGMIDDWFKLRASHRSGTRDGLKMYEKLLFQAGLAVLLGFFAYQHGGLNAPPPSIE